MEKKDYVVAALNGLLAVGLVALMAIGRITWEQLLIGLGLLATPSAGSLVMAKEKKP